LVAEPDRRNVRAGEDRESGGGSGISHANAAGDRDAGSADTDGTLDDGRPEGAEPDGPRPEGPVAEGAVGEASSHDGFAADSAGSVTVQPGGAGWVPWDDPMVSAGSAGTPSAMVSSKAAAEAVSFAVAAALPLAEASLPPFAEASLVPSIAFPLAGAPLAERPPPAVPSDTASSGGAAWPGADLAALGVLVGRLGGATTSPGRLSWSSSTPIRSSPLDLEDTTVGEAPPEPSDLSLRLSKPSSL
jgi:hypothetical protein